MKKVLVAPLNWGLGHATRCIPIINELINQGVHVFIASDGNALQLLKIEFPKLTFFELPSYNITYGSCNTLIFEMFKIFKNTKKAIAAEHAALEKLTEAHHFDLIISDNRYGIYNDKVHSVFITHQINIQVPTYLKWSQPLLLSHNLKLISKFNECWIPDYEGEENLSGALSHHCKLAGNTYYIGLLSRFFNGQLARGNNQGAKDNYQLLILLSGPEPQRTIFEKIIISQVNITSSKTLIVQGITETAVTKQLSENVWITSYLTSTDLIEKINAATLIISRSGYSTIMDLAATQCKALLVPTPGQTEQEYLAKKFHDKGIFYSVSQSDFKLADIEKAKTFKGLKGIENLQLLKGRMENLLV